MQILNAWVGHPRIRIIDNSTDFKGKIQRVIDVVCQVVGAPRPVNTERKYIASSIDPGNNTHDFTLFSSFQGSFCSQN
jgi:hypothetical protein